MKKFLSMVCVLALALALCVPAFADATAGQATPGQIPGIIEDKAYAVKSDPGNYDLAVDLRNTINDNRSAFVSYDASEAMYLALMTQPSSSYSSSEEGTNKNIIFQALAAAGMGDLNLDVHGPANNEINVVASFASGQQSPLGTYMWMIVPASEIDASIDYMWVCDGQYGDVEVVKLAAGDTLNDGTVLEVDSVQLAFYAPHFSTYRLAPASRLIAERNAANAGSPVLAATNADMNMTAVIAAAMALVLTAGSAVVLKKRSLSK